MSRKPKNKDFMTQVWESQGTTYIDTNNCLRKETFARIFESMLISPAFTSLNSKQKCLYLYCKAQYMGKHKPERDFPDCTEVRGADKFYMSWAAVQKYGLYKPTMSANFYNDMKALREHGLVELVSSGKGQRMKSIYKFSDRWKNWEQERSC